MSTQKTCLAKIYRTMALAIVALSLFSTNCMATSSSDSLTVELFKNPLKIYTFPYQYGQANSNFYLNLRPYTSAEKDAHTIYYRVTNNLPTALDNIELRGDVPDGLTQNYFGYENCPKQFYLRSAGSCLLEFDVDTNKYTPSAGDDPLICSENECSWPTPDQQFNEAVKRPPQHPQLIVTPGEQDGLSYDPASLFIVGKPERPGVYSFKISTANGVPRELSIFVRIDPRDKPVFKTDTIIASATPGQDYRLNLMDLIEPTPGFMKTNQVSFRIDRSHACPEWISLDKSDL